MTQTAAYSVFFLLARDLRVRLEIADVEAFLRRAAYCQINACGARSCSVQYLARPSQTGFSAIATAPVPNKTQ
ncbi:MAG: hypothetical protein AB4050_20605 [Synechococcus sp.]